MSLLDAGPAPEALVTPPPPVQTEASAADESGDLVSFVDQYEVPYAWVKVGDHREVVGLRGKTFRNWLVRAA